MTEHMHEELRDSGGDGGAGESVPAGRAGESEPAGRAGESEPAGRAGESEPAGRAGESEPAGRAGESEPAGRAGESDIDVVLVTGLSGAGRGTAATVLEDLGWYVAHNLPPELIAQ